MSLILLKDHVETDAQVTGQRSSRYMYYVYVGDQIQREEQELICCFFLVQYLQQIAGFLRSPFSARCPRPQEQRIEEETQLIQNIDSNKRRHKITVNTKIPESWGTGEIAQSVGCLLCKYEKPNLDAQNCLKKFNGMKREFNKEIDLLKEAQL